MALITGRPSNDVRDWCGKSNVEYLLKPVEKITFERFLRLRRPRAFVVHGRDKQALKRVLSVLRTIRIEPIVLFDCASRGRTVIEKFEQVASECDVAIVVISPDDVGRLATGSWRSRGRMRQNVLFELGYFCGAFGRSSGSVVLLEFGDVEIPSDLAGLVSLRADGSKTRLTAALRAELSGVLS